MTLKEFLTKENLSLLPHDSVIECIDGRVFSFGEIKPFKQHASYLASIEYKRCFELFERKSNSGFDSIQSGTIGYKTMIEKYLRILKVIKERELPHKEELQRIAEETIREIYFVDEGLKMNPIIGEPEDFGFDSSTEEMDEVVFDISKERMDYISDCATKRIIANSLAHGSSTHIWKSSHYLAKEKIDAIDFGLMYLYDQYASIVSMMIWMISMSVVEQQINDGEAIVQGMSFIGDKIDIEQEEFDDVLEEEYKLFLNKQEREDVVYGNAVGTIFPVLLHELNKVVFESLASNLIPEDLNNEELMLYFDIADKYSDEVFHYYMGPTLWSELLSFMNERDFVIVELYEFFEKCSSDDMSSFFELIISNKEQAFEMFKIINENE